VDTACTIRRGEAHKFEREAQDILLYYVLVVPEVGSGLATCECMVRDIVCMAALLLFCIIQKSLQWYNSVHSLMSALPLCIE